MAIIELSILTSAIVAMGVETAWEKTKRREAVLKQISMAVNVDTLFRMPK